MKKLISILMIAVLATACMLPVFAESAVTVTASKEEAVSGETVKVDFVISEATFATYGMEVIYDEEALELVSIVAGEATKGVFVEYGDNQTNVATAIGTADETVSGVLFTVEFKVITETLGTYPVTAKIGNVTTAEAKPVEATAVAGEVKVVCDHDWEWVTDKEPEGKEDGIKHEECKKCGEKRNEGTIIDNPNTGDNTVQTIMMVVSVMGMIAVAGTVSYRRRLSK